MVPRLLSQWPFKGGIILAPGKDISNLANFSKANQNTMAEQSACNIVQVGENKSKVTQYANQVLREAVDPSRLHDTVYHS